MQVGVGLPNGVPGTEATALLEWARRAERGPFSSIGVIDRVAYDCYEPMAALAASATVTERVKLATMVVIGPLRTTALLAKEAAFIDQISGGRLVLGISIGARESDYEAAGVPARERGRHLDRQLEELREHWEHGPGPRPALQTGPPLLVGGMSDRALARMARYGDGYVHNGGPPRVFERAADKAVGAWIDAGRPGRPQLWGQSYFALGDDARERGLEYMRDYYAFAGPFAEKIAEGLLTTPQAVAAQVRGYAEAGCDELVLLPAVSDPNQVERLADALA